MTNPYRGSLLLLSMLTASAALNHAPKTSLLRLSVSREENPHRLHDRSDIQNDFLQQLIADDTDFFRSRSLMSMSTSSSSSSPDPATVPPNAKEGTQSSNPTPQPSKGGSLASSNAPSDTPSAVPSANPTPSLFQSETVLGCTPGGIVVASRPFDAVSQLRFKILYLVETSDLDSIQNKLDRLLVLTATAGALQCPTGGELFDDLDSDSFSVPLNSSITTAPCETDVGTCWIVETEFRVVVNEGVDADVAVFLGNLFVRDQIDEGIMTDAIPQVDRAEYLGPQPLLPTIVADDDDLTQTPVLQATERLTVSAWTVGAVLAMSVGGVVAIGAWFRNRRTRNRRHMQLVEDDNMSMASPAPSEVP